ncbi:MAG TPA: DUF3105 domain-containing protein [Thermoleophilaceae bacterium]|jgi:hypothetical protein|nr:DUF3105 domain-containing protein [Thermoleophilaceae bacterium]
MASRKEQKEKLRRERLERERAAAAAAARRRRMGYVVAGALVTAVVVAVVAIAFASSGDSGGGTSGAGSWPSGSVPGRKVSDLDSAVKAAGCTLQSKSIEGREHTLSNVKYKTAPPTSGPHNPVPAHDGAYVKSPGNTHLVHALEHGRVIYWYKSSTPASIRGDLKALYDEDKALVIIAPDTSPFPYQVAATSWGKLLGCPRYNDKVPDAFRAFRDAYRLKGPEYFPNAE